MHTNRIKSLIERRLLTPSYVIMLAGLLVRSVALVLSAAIPYGSWPLVVRVAVELFAALGMIGCADIVLSAASAREAAIRRQMDAVHNSDEYIPNARLSGERFTQQKAILDAKRERALAALENDRKKEWAAVLFAGFITVSYGILFGITVLASVNIVAIFVEVIGVAAIPFVTWYISAQYREETAAPDESAKAIALEGVDQRLGAAKDRLSRGEERGEDLSLLEVATGDSPYHRKLVAALRPADTTVLYLSTPDIYKLLGVYDGSGQSTIRRIVRRCGEKHEHGVIADPQTGQWRTPKASLIEMFPQFIGPMRESAPYADAKRTSVSRPRARNTVAGAAAGVFSAQGSGSARTMPGALAPMSAQPMR